MIELNNNNRFTLFILPVLNSYFYLIKQLQLHIKKTYWIIGIGFIAITALGFSFSENSNTPVNTAYHDLYFSKLKALEDSFRSLKNTFKNEDLNNDQHLHNAIAQVKGVRRLLKSADIWLRYLEPVAYMKLNGALPVEWENEVFEKFEPPYKRNGSGLSLMETYLEEGATRDSLIKMADSSLLGTEIFQADSITRFLNKPDHFFYANRLFILNIAAIYTTSFECPDKDAVIPELRAMLKDTRNIYEAFNSSFPEYAITKAYMDKYDQLIRFADAQPSDINHFDHYRLLRDFANPLFAMNQKMIQQYRVWSVNFNDYTLSNEVASIFDKGLYEGQNIKGIYLPVDDSSSLAEIERIGKLLFYDPILSGNIKRSCASCHKTDEFFADHSYPTSLQFDPRYRLARNTPGLVNSIYNQLIMLDGKHYSLLNQAKNVVSNPQEMGDSFDQIIHNVMSCPDYAKAFKKFVKLTPNSPKLKIDHIVSTVILYYSKFSKYYGAFDRSINNHQMLDPEAIKGYNVFMGKAQCGTCHFPPQFNGVKPPYISSEFEVLGVPADSNYHSLSPDSGRALINPAYETMHAFRTPTVRNAFRTGPYMHNGVFSTIDQVIEFYDHGGGVGHKLKVENQTLPPDSLHLTTDEKNQLKAFMKSLDEDVIFESLPDALPRSKNNTLQNRVIGGEY